MGSAIRSLPGRKIDSGRQDTSRNRSWLPKLRRAKYHTSVQAGLTPACLTISSTMEPVVSADPVESASSASASALSSAAAALCLPPSVSEPAHSAGWPAKPSDREPRTMLWAAMRGGAGMESSSMMVCAASCFAGATPSADGATGSADAIAEASGVDFPLRSSSNVAPVTTESLMETWRLSTPIADDSGASDGVRMGVPSAGVAAGAPAPAAPAPAVAVVAADIVEMCES